MLPHWTILTHLLALYRDVPRVDELKSVGNFSSYLPPNAEELVDWALSHIPKSKCAVLSDANCLFACRGWTAPHQAPQAYGCQTRTAQGTPPYPCPP